MLPCGARVLMAKPRDLVHFLVHNRIVKRVNRHDAKTNLSRSLRKKAVRKPRMGAAKGQFVVPNSFFEPLPDEILKAFLGK
jgi:hypothetical protein